MAEHRELPPQGTEVVRLFADNNSRGQPIFEQVLVERCAETKYRILRSPGLVLGIAAGDIIELREGNSAEFDVLSRGGNICIQVFAREDLDAAERWLSERLGGLDGRLDGGSQKVIVYTIPCESGFPEIEAIMERFLREFPDAEWSYGNVYDPSDGVTPLNWWCDNN